VQAIRKSGIHLRRKSARSLLGWHSTTASTRRKRLLRRGVVTGSACPFGCQADEDLTHMLFLCPHTSFLWRNFNIQNLQGLRTVRDMVTNPRLVQPAQRAEWPTIFIAIVWNIWLTRNRKAFDNVRMMATSMESNCWDTISLWANRCKNSTRRKAISDWASEGRPATC
jgi:hypothetical protein